MFNQKDSNFIALDLGTKNTLAYVSKQGIIYNEASIMAYDAKTNELIALGNEAYNMLGKTHDNIRMVTPLVNGVISDLEATKELLRCIFLRIRSTNIWKNAIVVLACPSGVTQLEREALKEVAKEMGARHVLIEEEVKMAALGAGINIDSSYGNLVVDLGGGTFDGAILAAGDIILSRSIKAAGNSIDKQISNYMRSTHNILIGSRTAEKIKIEIGSLVKFSNEKPLKIFGRDIVSGLPKDVIVTPEEIRNLLITTLMSLVDLLVEILENAPPELAGDIIKNGITLCGGGAKLRGLDKYLQSIFEFPVNVAPEPLATVINGAKTYEKKIDEILKKIKYEEMRAKSLMI